MPLEIELTWSWYTVFTMANLFVIHLKSQTMKSVMNEVNWMVERNLGLEWDVDAFLARALKEGLCERWYWGATWMMRKKHPCEDVGSSSKVSSKCKFSETEMRLAALWNRKRTWWHYKVPDIRFRYKCQILASLAKSMNFIPNAMGNYWRVLHKRVIRSFIFLKDFSGCYVEKYLWQNKNWSRETTDKAICSHPSDRWWWPWLGGSANKEKWMDLR